MYQLLSIMASIMAFLIGSYLFLDNRESRFHRIYAAGFFITGLFTFFLFGMSIARTQEEAWTWLRLSAAIHLIPPVTLHAILQVYRSQNDRLPWRHLAIIYVPFVAFIFIDGVFPELTYHPLKPSAMGWEVDINTKAPLQVINMITYFVCIGIQGYFLVKLLRGDQPPTHRKFALFVTLTYLVPILLSAILVFVLPYFVDTTLRLESIFAFLVCIATGYCLYKLNVFDLSVHVVSQDIISSMSNFLLLLDARGYVVDGNQSTEKLLGVPLEQLEGQPVDVLIGVDERHRILKRKKIAENVELSLTPPSKTPIPVMLSVSPIVKKGEFLGHILIGNDLRKVHNLIEEKKIVELELKAMVRQMNPHFLSNSLNGLQHFILQQDEVQVNNYLTKFSRLMRNILYSTERNLVSLQKEIENLRLYLELEQLRFQGKFTFAMEVDEALSPEWLVVAPMMIQPFLENAIWHGLLPKEGDAELRVAFDLEEHHVRCTVQDNGIGRELAEKLQQRSRKHHHSVAIRNITERIELLNRSREPQRQMQIKITDLYDDQQGALGTKAELWFPLQFQHVPLTS